MLNAGLHLVHCETEAGPQKQRSGDNPLQEALAPDSNSADLGLIFRDLDWGSLCYAPPRFLRQF
jgi:hypothetical protein